MDMNLDALLDTPLADVADLPEYVTPPNGSYLATIEEITVEPKTIKDQPALEAKVKWKLDATLELADPNSVPVKDGSVATENFLISNAEYGMPGFKRSLFGVAQAVANANGIDPSQVTPRQLIESGKGMTVLITVKNRKDKEDKTKSYFATSGSQLPE